MTYKLEKVKNLLQKQFNVQIRSLWTEKNRCCFLYCLDNTGNFFFLNVKPYDIFLDETIMSPWPRYYIKFIQDPQYLSLRYYEQFVSNFPRYLNQIVYYIDDYIILNQNNIYKVIQNTTMTGFHCIYRKFNLDWLYENKWNFTSEILALNDELDSKVNYLRDNHIIQNANISSKISPGFLESSSEMIEEDKESFEKYRKLLINVNSFQSQLVQEIKNMDDFSGHKSINDTKKQIEMKNKKKTKIKSLENIKKDIIKNLESNYSNYLHKTSLYIFYKSELDKKFINLESCFLEFEKKLQS